VAALRSHHDAIRDGFQSGSPEQAHDPLHEVGHVLEALPELAADADLSASDIEALQSAVDQMFAGYGAVDDAMHSGEEPDYDAVAEQLEESLKAIEQLLAGQTETDATPE
jgi:hypothetical protein